MRYFLIAFLSFFSVSIYSLESFFILQPTGWKYEQGFDNRISQSKESFYTLIEPRDDGFSVERTDFSYIEDDDAFHLLSDKFDIVLRKSDNILISEDDDQLHIKVQSNTMLFLLSNDNLRFFLDDNEILFPVFNDQNIAFSPSDVKVTRNTGGLKYDEIQMLHDKYFIRMFGPIELSNDEKLEYGTGEVLGRFKTSVWMSFRPWGDIEKFSFTPILIYDNEIVSYQDK